MKIQVVVTHTDARATTNLMSNGGESSKNYVTWGEALKEAEQLKLINTEEATDTLKAPLHRLIEPTDTQAFETLCLALEMAP